MQNNGRPWISPKKAVGIDLSNLTDSFGIETILQVLGTTSLVQFVIKKLLFAEILLMIFQVSLLYIKIATYGKGCKGFFIYIDLPSTVHTNLSFRDAYICTVTFKGAAKSIYAPEPCDVGRVQVEISTEDHTVTASASGPIDPSAGLGNNVEALVVQRHETEFTVCLFLSSHQILAFKMQVLVGDASNIRGIDRKFSLLWIDPLVYFDVSY